jgi:hypothetical protein
MQRSKRHETTRAIMNKPPVSRPRITPESLLTLEAYAKARKDYRAKVIAHKKPRTVRLGEHLTLAFEDETTMRYQIQEMLRIEKIFESEAIQDEIDAYQPLVPDGTNLKATMMIEYEDVDERRRALARLRDIEDRVWVQAEGHGKVFAIADEDLDRETDEKTSSVHFLRFELDPGTIAALKAGAALAIGVDHPNYQATIPAVAPATRLALVADLACREINAPGA